MAHAVVAGRWKPALVRELHARPLHFGELRRRVGGISEEVLAGQLRNLEDDGVLTREVYRQGEVTRVRHALTAQGQALDAAVHALAERGQAHRRQPQVLEAASVR